MFVFLLVTSGRESLESDKTKIQLWQKEGANSMSEKIKYIVVRGYPAIPGAVTHFVINGANCPFEKSESWLDWGAGAR